MVHFILIILFVIATSFVNAECNFVTGNYIDKLNSPSSIREIKVETPKIQKYNKNFSRILVSNSFQGNIPPKLKKNFKATITVKYDFGICKYKSKIRQHGDLKDHISLKEGGQPIRSLKVKLENGNILNSVRFSLLIPNTRNNIHEILGTLILKKLGFIAPETFQVMTSVNGVKSIMLFQEDSQKELLERNLRREGPLFEGDEDIIWSYKNFDEGLLYELALSKLINKNWFKKGVSSQNITLSSYFKLQKAYIDNEQNLNSKRYIVFPNKQESPIFEDYFFILYAMNGRHSYFLNNRKFYFNSFLGEFEPIYYDGMLDFQKEIIDIDPYFYKAFSKNYSFTKINEIEMLINDNDLLDNLKSRVVLNNKEVKNFYKNSMTTFFKNINLINSELNRKNRTNYKEKKFDQVFKKYINNSKKLKFDQRIFFLKSAEGDYFKIQDTQNFKETINSKEMADLIGENKFHGKRAILIKSLDKKDNYNFETNLIKQKFENGEIIRSNNTILKINKLDQSLIIEQNDINDWVLFRKVNLNNWTIKYIAQKETDSINQLKKQRFNKYGLTGCLNFYESILSNVKIDVINGSCEDSLNIVKSNGTISHINVYNANSDAIDIDFSRIEIDKIIVENAKNDCLDVSGGSYTIKNAKLSNCADKGISVGEKSNFEINNINIDSASIGLSSKDYSKLFALEARINNTITCYEATQKKQEFGGAFLKIMKLNCNGKYLNDENSKVEILENEF